MPCSVPDLVRLSDIHNLAVLQIIGRKEEAATDRALGVGDRLIRAWHLAALNSGAFPVLRFLRIWYFKNVTEQSLSFLNAFPALALYDVQGCGLSRRSPRQPASGWTLCSDKLFSYTVDRVYRDKILDPSWLGTIGAELVKSGAHDGSSQRAKPPPSFGQNRMTFVPRVEVPDMLCSSIFSRRNYYRVMWEEMTYILSPLVGAARNDTDLVSAGYVVSDPLAIGDILGSSIPMVSLRIGKDSESSFDLNTVAFIRDNLLDPLNLNGCENGHEVSEQGRQSVRRQTSKNERQGQGVIQTKKRKLNDLLNSLL